MALRPVSEAVLHHSIILLVGAIRRTYYVTYLPHTLLSLVQGVL